MEAESSLIKVKHLRQFAKAHLAPRLPDEFSLDKSTTRYYVRMRGAFSQYLVLDKIRSEQGFRYNVLFYMSGVKRDNLHLSANVSLSTLDPHLYRIVGLEIGDLNSKLADQMFATIEKIRHLN